MGSPHVDAVRRYQKKCDAIMLRPKLEEGRKIRETAKSEGVSVQALMLRLFREYTK